MLAGEALAACVGRAATSAIINAPPATRILRFDRPRRLLSHRPGCRQSRSYPHGPHPSACLVSKYTAGACPGRVSDIGDGGRPRFPPGGHDRGCRLRGHISCPNSLARLTYLLLGPRSRPGLGSRARRSPGTLSAVNVPVVLFIEVCATSNRLSLAPGRQSRPSRCSSRAGVRLPWNARLGLPQP